MKFQQLNVFEKHLAQAAPDHLSKVYLVVAGCPVERRYIAQRIFEAIRRKEQKIEIQSLNASEISVNEVMNELNTCAFLGDKRVVWLDEVDKWKKNGLAALGAYVERPAPFAYVVLGASSGKGLAELYQSGKRELIACDLGEEKPWERKERLKQYLSQSSAQAGKRLHPQAAELMLERSGSEFSTLEQELLKLFCYVGERAEIVASDVESVGVRPRSLTLWQIADALVWNESGASADSGFDLSDLLLLIAAVRLQLQQGLQMALLLEQGVTPHALASQLPHIKPKAIELHATQARRLKSSFFTAGLEQLFEIELLAKNSSSAPLCLFDLLHAKLINPSPK